MVNEIVCILSFLCTDILKGYVQRVLQDIIIRTLVYRVERLFSYTQGDKKKKKKVWPGHFNYTNLKMLTQFLLCKYQNTQNSLMCNHFFFFSTSFFLLHSHALPILPHHTNHIALPNPRHLLSPQPCHYQSFDLTNHKWLLLRHSQQLHLLG